MRGLWLALAGALATACTTEVTTTEPDASTSRSADAGADAEAHEGGLLPPGPCCVEDPHINELLAAEGVLCCDAGS